MKDISERVAFAGRQVLLFFYARKPGPNTFQPAAFLNTLRFSTKKTPSNAAPLRAGLLAGSSETDVPCTTL